MHTSIDRAILPDNNLVFYGLFGITLREVIAERRLDKLSSLLFIFIRERAGKII